jgi:hypothetical protein
MLRDAVEGNTVFRGRYAEDLSLVADLSCLLVILVQERRSLYIETFFASSGSPVQSTVVLPTRLSCVINSG